MFVTQSVGKKTQMRDKCRNLLFFILRGLWFLAKALITMIFIFLAIYDQMTIDSFFRDFPGKDGEMWSYVTSLMYVILLYVISAYLVYWTFLGLKRLHYVILGFCLIVLYFTGQAIPLQLARSESICADNGYVWDEDRQECRDDCLTWNEKEGCVP